MKDMPQRPMSKNCKNKFNVKREKMAKDYFMQQSLPNGSWITFPINPNYLALWEKPLNDFLPSIIASASERAPQKRKINF